MLIVALWKDSSKEIVSNNYSLPQSLPSTTEIPTPQQEQEDLKDLVQENFQPPKPEESILAIPEPVVETEQISAPEPILETEERNIPEPGEDLDSLYKQIEEIKQEEENSSK